MMYMSDCVAATMQILEADNAKLTRRTYNVTATSFSPGEVAAEIKKHIPSFEMTCVPDFRQKIADGWPRAIDDSLARRDWQWSHKYGTADIVKDMIEKIGEKLAKEKEANKKSK